LGDSYSSGNGAGNYFDQVCYRSDGNWGKTAADNLGATYSNRACSGADVTDLSSQDDAVDSSTDLVLVGAGGNDLDFADVVLQCFIPTFRSHSDCFRVMDTATSRLPSLQTNLRNAFLDIRNRNNNVVVVLVAYPYITQNTAYTTDCCGFNPPNMDIITGLRDLGDTVTATQRNAVAGANAEAGETFVYFYENTGALFEGHEPHPDSDVENPDRWIYEWGLFFNDFETYHLNPTGHAQLGNALAPFIASVLNLPPTRPPTEAPAPAFLVSEPTASFCYSPHATAMVKDKGKVAMKDLQVGDYVLTSNGQYQTVYTINHFHHTKPTNFLQIRTEMEGSENENALEVSPMHLVYVEGKDHPLPANDVKVGDYLQTLDHGPKKVNAIRLITRNGLYNPITTHGTMVVDGIVTSSYTSFTGSAYLKIAGIELISVHDLLNMTIAPYRAFCMATSSLNLCNQHREGELPILVQLLSNFYAFWSEQNAPLQFVIISIYVSIFSLTNIFLGEYAMYIFAVVIGWFLVTRGTPNNKVRKEIFFS